MLLILPLNLLFKDIKKNNYKEELEAAGVQMIQKDHVSVQTKIALGRPYSGDVYNATWTQNRNKVHVDENKSVFFLYWHDIPCWTVKLLTHTSWTVGRLSAACWLTA